MTVTVYHPTVCPGCHADDARGFRNGWVTCNRCSLRFWVKTNV